MITKDSYEKDVFYKDQIYGRIMKVTGWFDLSDCPKVIMKGMTEKRTWKKEYLIKATKQDIIDDDLELLNTHTVSKELTVSLDKDGLISLIGRDEMVFMDLEEFDVIKKIIENGYKKTLGD